MKHCRLCKSKLNQPVIEMTVPAGTQLFSDSSTTSASLRNSLQLLQCKHCGLVQSVGEPVYYEHVSSSSSFVSDKLLSHRNAQIMKLHHLSKKPIRSLVDVGCGDGAILAGLEPTSFDLLLGIEPTTKNVSSAREKGLTIQHCLVDDTTIFDQGPYDAVCSFHVMEHTTDIISVLKGIHCNLTDDGVGVIEVPATEAAFEKQRIGDFMPDHINYFTAETMKLALNISGFEVLECYRDWNSEHLVTYFKKRNIEGNLEFISRRTDEIRNVLTEFAAEKRKVIIWGASHHMMPNFIIFDELLPEVTVIDNSSEKSDRYIPGTKIKVTAARNFSEFENATVIIGAPRFEHEIVSELEVKLAEPLKLCEHLTQSIGFPVYEV